MQDATRIPTSPELMDDEIDLRKYIDVLFAWRWEILLATTLAALLAGGAVLGLRFLQTPMYKANATVAIARTSSNINFDENFRTTLSDQGMTTAARADVLVGTRRAALVGLVSSGAVAESVSAQLDSSFTEEERVPRRLMANIEAEAVVAPGSRTEGDLIQITAKADSPEKAAALATAWAHTYVEHINRLYGEVPEQLLASVQGELEQTQSSFDSAQRNLEAFISDNKIDRLDREIAEKRQIIDSLQAGKQTAIQTIIDEELAARRQVISAYINAISSNRLLAFNKEQEAKRSMITALIDADASSRLAAFQKDQEARRTLFDQYVSAELENRALALTTDQELRRQIFNAYTAADTRGKVVTFNEQVDARLQALAQNYETRQRLQRLLGDARGLLTQVRTAGETGAATNALALLLLKSQVFNTAAAESATIAQSDFAPATAAQSLAAQTAAAQTVAAQTAAAQTVAAQSSAARAAAAQSTAALSVPLQLRLDNLAALSGDLDAQTAELTALVGVIDERITELTASIETQTQSLLANQGYTLLDESRPADDPLFAALQAQYAALFDVGELATLDAASGSALSEAILARYDDLFALGPLAQASSVLSATTPLLETIQTQYPYLFDVGEISALTEDVISDTGLSMLGEERARELLQLQGLEDLPTYTAAAAPLTAAIDTLESEIRALQAQREAEVSRRDELVRARDLALKSLTTLKNKVAELALAGTALTSEVRFASPALPPLRPESRTSLVMATALGALVGLLAGVFIALFANYMGSTPPLSRRVA
jgi:capsular polysaccharide biosynthesis protein